MDAAAITDSDGHLPALRAEGRPPELCEMDVCA